MQDCLSGALRERVAVKEWNGAIRALIPWGLLVPNGIRMVENAVPGQPAIIHGSLRAVANAERRLAKMVGEGWGARLVGFDADTGLAAFEVSRADA